MRAGARRGKGGGVVGRRRFHAIPVWPGAEPGFFMFAMAAFICLGTERASEVSV